MSILPTLNPIKPHTLAITNEYRSHAVAQSISHRQHLAGRLLLRVLRPTPDIPPPSLRRTEVIDLDATLSAMRSNLTRAGEPFAGLVSGLAAALSLGGEGTCPATFWA